LLDGQRFYIFCQLDSLGDIGRGGRADAVVALAAGFLFVAGAAGNICLDDDHRLFRADAVGRVHPSEDGDGWSLQGGGDVKYG